MVTAVLVVALVVIVLVALSQITGIFLGERQICDIIQSSKVRLKIFSGVQHRACSHWKSLS